MKVMLSHKLFSTFFVIVVAVIMVIHMLHLTSNQARNIIRVHSINAEQTDTEDNDLLRTLDTEQQNQKPTDPIPPEMSTNKPPAFISERDYWDKSNKTRPLIEIVTFGRLGNHIFHYGVVYCVALQTHRTPTIGRDNYLLTLFPDLSAKKVNTTYFPKTMHLLNDSLRVGEDGWSMYNWNILDQVRRSNKTWLKGTYQSWRYFTGCEKSLRRELTFNDELQDDVNMQMRTYAYDYMKGNNISFFHDITFVGIHVRLGDIMKPDLQAEGHTNAPPSYIKKAMDYFQNKYRWPLFIAASEDIQWCKDNINSTHNNVYFSNYSKPQYMQDFIMLSSCNNSILTVGSYGWFTGWFANGEVVYYDKYPVEGLRIIRGVNFTDRYPPGWIGMH